MIVELKRLAIISSFCFLFGAIISCTPKAKTEKFDLPKDQASVRRGEILVHGIAACGFCHGGDQSLKQGSYYQGNVGVLHARSLKTIGTASGYDIVQAIRDGKFQGKKLSGEPHAGYQWISDDDAISIATYLKSLPQVEGETTDSNDAPFWITRFWNWMKRSFKDTTQHTAGYVPAISQRYKKEYGNYLVDNVARCAKCHNGVAGFWGDEKYLGGGKDIVIANTPRTAPALVGEGTFSTWDRDTMVNYLKYGRSVNGSKICPLVGPQWYGKAGSDDLVAIATYIRSIKE